MRQNTHQAALESIRANIAQHGHHIYLITGRSCPRFAYTIGLSESHGAELIFAGGSVYDADSIVLILNRLATDLDRQINWHGHHVETDSHGSFSLGKAHQSWSNELMLGALDYYDVPEVLAYQVVPDPEHLTIDVPTMTEPWHPTTSPPWRWLHEQWNYPVPPNSVATTNLQALRGARITEAARWEEDQWELFAGAGPDVPKENVRVVPLGTLLAIDDSLNAVVHLPVGRGLWRDARSEWQRWN